MILSVGEAHRHNPVGGRRVAATRRRFRKVPQVAASVDSSKDATHGSFNGTFRCAGIHFYSNKLVSFQYNLTSSRSSSSISLRASLYVSLQDGYCPLHPVDLEVTDPSSVHSSM